MPALTEREAEIIELLRKGTNTKLIAKTIKRSRGTVISQLREMVNRGWVKHVIKGQYEVVLEKYEIMKQRPTAPSEHVQKWIDQTLNMLTVELDEDQLLYLDNHRQMKRTLLAKKLGISKLQLCYVLEQRRNGA